MRYWSSCVVTRACWCWWVLPPVCRCSKTWGGAVARVELSERETDDQADCGAPVPHGRTRTDARHCALSSSGQRCVSGKAWEAEARARSRGAGSSWQPGSGSARGQGAGRTVVVGHCGAVVLVECRHHTIQITDAAGQGQGRPSAFRPLPWRSNSRARVWRCSSARAKACVLSRGHRTSRASSCRVVGAAVAGCRKEGGGLLTTDQWING
jgi:hypothetical protein